MLVRFTMFPIELDLLPIYERLIGCPERTAAKTLRALLYRTGGSLPSWFEELPRKPFPSTRAKTIRLTIPPPTSEPALSYLHQMLEPMDSTQRLIKLKAHLIQMVSPAGHSMVSNVKETQAGPTEWLPAVLPASPQPLAIATTEAPKAGGITKEEIQGKFKGAALSYR